VKPVIIANRSINFQVMRGILFFFLRIYSGIRRTWFNLRGINESDIHIRRIVTGKAWEDFCDHLKTAGAALVYSGTPQDEFQQAEGIRYLTRLTRAALEAYVEYGDPAFPVLKRMVHETVKLGADNPDNYYMNALISGNYEYRITGIRNTIDYIGFFTQNGNYGTTGGMAPCGVLENKDLKINQDGSFEIILSPTHRGQNWLKIEPETTILVVRQTYYDRENEIPADLKIENLDGRTSPDPIDAFRLDKGLETAALFVAGAPMLFARWVAGFQKHSNRLPQFDPVSSNAAGGDENIIYYHSHWKLDPDQALVIEVNPPDCDTWNFQLNNYWMESLDYRYFNISLNKKSAHYEDDHSVKVIVAHEDPGHPNWITTCLHHEGTMCWRWYRLKKGVTPVEPSCKVVKLKEWIQNV
jgi:hypothetical protein